MNSRKRYSRRYAKTRKQRRKTRRRRAVSKRRVRRTARRVHTRRRRRRTAINHKGGSLRSGSRQSELTEPLLQKKEQSSTGLFQTVKNKAGQFKDNKRLKKFHEARTANLKKHADELRGQPNPSIKPSIDEISALFKGGKYIPDIDGLLLSNVVSLRHMILCAIEQTINTYGTGLSEGKTSLLAKEALGIPFTKYKFQKETKQATYYRLAIREAFDLEEVSDSTELIILVDLYNRVNNYISFLRKRIVSSEAAPEPTSIYNHVCTILENTVDNPDTRISEDEPKTTDTKEVLEQLFETPGISGTTDGGVVVFMILKKDRKHSVEKRLLSQYPQGILKPMIEKLRSDRQILDEQGYTSVAGPYEQIRDIQRLEQISDSSLPQYFDNIEDQYRQQMDFSERYETQHLRHGATHEMLADAGLESAKLAADIYGTSIENAISSSSVAKLIGEAGTKAGIITTGGVLTASSITVKELMKKLKSFVEKCVANTNSFYDSSNSEPYKTRENQVIFILKGETPEVDTSRVTISGDVRDALLGEAASPADPPTTALADPPTTASADPPTTASAGQQTTALALNKPLIRRV